MIEYEAHLRAAAHQFDRLVELMVLEAEFEMEPAPRHLAHPAHERFVQREPRRMPLDIVAHAAHQRHRRHRVEPQRERSEEHTSELQSLMRISYAVFCLKKNKQ